MLDQIFAGDPGRARRQGLGWDENYHSPAPRAGAMPSPMTRSAAVERAYELARSGQCRSVAAIIRRLPDEDRAAVEEHLRIPAARRDLILVCSDAWLAAG